MAVDPGRALDPDGVVAEEVGRTSALPFRTPEIFGPDIRPILYSCNEEQQARFLYPALRGELKVCFAQTEPDAGSDVGAMRTRASYDEASDAWIINGTKT